MNTMHTSQTILEMVDQHMLGSAGWPASNIHVAEFWRLHDEMGYGERLKDGGMSYRCIQLPGCDTELMACFLGAIDLWSIPITLAEKQLISEREADGIYNSENAEAELERCVRLAYLRYYKTHSLPH